MSDDRQSPASGQRFPLVGCCEVGRNRALYFQRFDVLEYQQSFFQPPKQKALQQLKKAAPQTFSFVVRAWQLVTHEPTFPGYRRLSDKLTAPENQYGLFRDTEPVQQAWQTTWETAQTVGAQAVFFETPPSFTPSALHRKALARFFEKVPRDSVRLVWCPKGLWTLSEALAVCQDLDLVLAWDPLLDREFPEAEQVYCKMDGAGRAAKLSDLELEDLYSYCRDKAWAVCVFNTFQMQQDATRLKALAELL